MAVGDKPYRRYRGGRVKGRVPLERKSRAAERPAGPAAPKRRRHYGRWALLAAVGLIVLFFVWGVLGFLSFSRGVAKANDRLPRRAVNRLAEPNGSILSTPTTTLLIGTDGGRAPGRENARRSDSLLLVRTDPDKHRLAYLSIPRDLRVEIPGFGSGKVNAANQFGGPALTLATVRNLTGLPIHHVVVVDFKGFKDLIDAIGGIELNVPKPILSNRFECPLTPKRCQSWKGWRFAKGKQHMDGRRALIYSRIRTNQLDPSDSDISRTSRQQAVAEAVGDEIASFGTFLRLPFIGDSLAAPIATDMSAWDLAKFGWVRFRAEAGRSLHCRLGGEPSTIGGESVILGGEDNVAVVSMFLGRSTPLAPPKGTLYGAGCTRR
jgi:polyisoprenyl-teichoic acid--peptidoglycan teichoic acid transferase